MFDVGKFAFDIPDIVAHMHTATSGREETFAGQRRALRKWISGRDKMHAVTKLSRDEVNARQLERVALLVDYAFSTHPFYHQLYKSAGYRRGDIITWNDYNALPTISKDDIIENYNLFTSSLGPSVKECYALRTSGSSGRILTTLMDPSWVDQEVLQYFRFYEQMLNRRRRPGDWQYLIYLSCPTYTSLRGFYPTFTVSIDCPPEAILSHVRQLKPTILTGLPSNLTRLASLVTDPSELGIRAISTNSEPSTKAERDMIAARIGAPVFDEYSSVELSLIAMECAKRRYHIVEDNVRVDVSNPDENGMGEIVATNLVNTYMPFIRYRQGDIIKVSSSSRDCECGNRFRHLEMFMGRSDQFLHSRFVGNVPPDRIMALYDRILISVEAGIEEFQIVQTKPDEVALFIVPASGQDHANAALIEDFSNGLRGLFNDPELKVQVQEMKAMPPNKSYKRRLIENRIK